MTPDDRNTEVDTNGPAAIVLVKLGDETHKPQLFACGKCGHVYSRDYFAGQALPAVITATSAGQHRPMRDDGLDLVRSMARDAYEIADAMIEARAALSASRSCRT